MFLETARYRTRTKNPRREIIQIGNSNQQMREDETDGEQSQKVQENCRFRFSFGLLLCIEGKWLHGGYMEARKQKA